MKKAKASTKKKDRLWSRAVMGDEHDCVCFWCGGQATDPMHIFGRNFGKTKYVVENGIRGCRNCHDLFDKNPVFKKMIIDKVIGEEVYKKLEGINNGKCTVEECGFREVGR